MQSTLRRTIPASLDGGEPIHLVQTWFRRSDPFGVEFNYAHNDVGQPLGIRVERDQLQTLLATPDAMTAVGTVMMWMGGSARFIIEFSASDGPHRLEFDAAMMRTFLDETEAVIPFGGESAAVAELFESDGLGL